MGGGQSSEKGFNRSQNDYFIWFSETIRFSRQFFLCPLLTIVIDPIQYDNNNTETPSRRAPLFEKGLDFSDGKKFLEELKVRKTIFFVS